jgi:PST family polysaccharide transporter
MSTPERTEGSLTKSVKSGVALSTLSFALTKGLAFITVLILTRLLAPRQFGVVAGILVVIGVIELTADLGMGATVIYEQEQGTERVQTAFTINLILGCVLAGLGVLAAPLIAGFFHASRHVGLYRLASLDVILTSLGGIHESLLLRDMRFNKRIITQVASAVVRAGVGIALAVSGFGAASLVWSMLAGTATWTATQWALTPFRPRLSIDRTIVRGMVRYGVAASLLELVGQVTISADVTVVGRVLGPRALGLYSVAYRLPTLLLENIANQVSLVAFPALSRKRVMDAEGVGASTHRLISYQALYSLPLAAGMAVMARPIITALFSARWLAATGVFAAVSVMSGISASGFALGDAFKALARQRVMVVLNLIQIPILVGTIIAVAPYGITAVAWARAGTVVLWVAMMIAAARWVLSVPVRGTLAAMWPGAVAALGVVLTTAPIRLWSGLAPVPAIVAAAAAGLVGAAAALALFSPSMFAEVARAASALKPRRSPPPSPIFTGATTPAAGISERRDRPSL